MHKNHAIRRLLLIGATGLALALAAGAGGYSEITSLALSLGAVSANAIPLVSQDALLTIRQARPPSHLSIIEGRAAFMGDASVNNSAATDTPDSPR